MDTRPPERNSNGMLVVEEAFYVMRKDVALRELPSPMQGVTSKESGAPRGVMFRLWKIGVRPAAGSDLRYDSGELALQYSVVELPVSDVHNGGVGCSKSEAGDFVFRPDHWTQAGWRVMSEIPSDWREHNAKIDKLAAQRERERNPNGLTAVDAIRALAEELRKDRSGDHAQAQRDDGGGAEVAGSAPEGDRAPGHRQGRRGAGAAGG